jgi:hypothetical protein
MTNRIDPHHTGPATDPAAEPTPTELLAWLRGREAVVDQKLGMLKRRLDGHVDYHAAHNTAGLERRLEEHVRSVDETVHDLRRDLTYHLDLHGGLNDGEEPDGVMVGPTGDGQSDLGMIECSQQLREAYRTFMRYAADPNVPKQQFDLGVHEFREQVFELTKQMRTALANREGQGAQTT